MLQKTLENTQGAMKKRDIQEKLPARRRKKKKNKYVLDIIIRKQTQKT